MAIPLSAASSRYHRLRQLRQNPARFIRSIFWTSVRSRRWPTSRRKAAASSSVLVVLSIDMVVNPRVAELCYNVDLGRDFCHIAMQTRACGDDNLDTQIHEIAALAVDSPRRATRDFR